MKTLFGSIVLLLVAANVQAAQTLECLNRYSYIPQLTTLASGPYDETHITLTFEEQNGRLSILNPSSLSNLTGRQSDSETPIVKLALPLGRSCAISLRDLKTVHCQTRVRAQVSGFTNAGTTDGMSEYVTRMFVVDMNVDLQIEIGSNGKERTMSISGTVAKTLDPSKAIEIGTTGQCDLTENKTGNLK